MEEKITFRTVVFIKAKQNRKKIINNKTLKSLDKNLLHTLYSHTTHDAPSWQGSYAGSCIRSESGKKRSSERLIHSSLHHAYTQSESLANLHFFFSLLKRNKLIVLTSFYNMAKHKQLFC